MRALCPTLEPAPCRPAQLSPCPTLERATYAAERCDLLSVVRSRGAPNRLRALRLVRVLRLLRLAQHSAELRVLVGMIANVVPALRMLGFFLALELIIVGGLAFHAERADGPDELDEEGMWLRADRTPAVFQSIPDAMWWTLVTVSTVGYGDQVTRRPHTLLGKAPPTHAPPPPPLL